MTFPGNDPIIVAGAGPVGASFALYLAREGFNVVLLEKEKTLPEDLRASTFHPPSMDMLDRLGVMPRLIELGLIVAKYQYRDRRTGEIAEFDMSHIKDETNHPYRLQCEQWRLNKICCEELAKIPNARVLFEHGVIKVLGQDADGVDVLLSTPDGERTMRGSYVIGAEGANSMVRQTTGLQYGGFTYPEKFLVASTPYPLEKFLPKLAGVNYVSDPEEWCVVLRCNNLWRVLFPTPPGVPNETLISDDYIQDRLQHLAPKQGDYEIGHKTLYNVHQRVADAYRIGRVLLAGDSAHINNPLGGMGMNGGLHDGFNLAEKFIAIRDGKMDADAALDQYDRQRRLTATKFVQEHTIANKRLMEEKDPDAQKKRQAEFMRTASDPALAKKFLMKSSMIQVVRDSYAIQ
ncbi:MAG: NAD(P)/FAD-dependent oxidoreductase [Rhodospirillaceae bacterium]|nr:NAD(P)/FAD-dependent oxidoreductase [Rhodospirillaceae bacterium]